MLEMSGCSNLSVVVQVLVVLDAAIELIAWGLSIFVSTTDEVHRKAEAERAYLNAREHDWALQRSVTSLFAFAAIVYRFFAKAFLFRFEAQYALVR